MLHWWIQTIIKERVNRLPQTLQEGLTVSGDQFLSYFRRSHYPDPKVRCTLTNKKWQPYMYRCKNCQQKSALWILLRGLQTMPRGTYTTGRAESPEPLDHSLDETYCPFKAETLGEQRTVWAQQRASWSSRVLHGGGLGTFSEDEETDALSPVTQCYAGCCIAATIS